VTDRKIARYEVVRRLGVGGMGEVFLARDPELERSVAIKVMSAELAKDADQRKRFRAEAKAASALVHPNIVVILEVGETEDGRPFLAMEYVEGQTLDAITAQRRLRIREVLNLGLEVADALELAHSRGIVHRDIKPANIMLNGRGAVKVLDFGLAKRFAEDELSAPASGSGSHTRTGMLIGTPHYMSPEQVLGRELDNRSDLFSLGVVLYELVSGQKPFRGRTVGETINNVVNQAPEPLGLENPVYSPALDAIIFKCLEKEPQKRYESAKALARDLAKLRTESERANAAERTTPDRARERPSHDGARSGVVRSEAAPARLPFRWGPVLVPAMSLTSLLLLVAIGYLFIHLPTDGAKESSPPATNAPHQNSIAVLPFDNFSGDSDSDYLSEGLTEEITTALSRIHGLKVAARNSAFTFKGKKDDARAIGAALRVSTLLEGSVRKDGKKLRVTAQLINVADGFQLWSDTYDRSVEDIFAVQEDIARRIAERLQGQTNGPAPVARTVNAEAHLLYLQARLFWNKRTEAGLKRALQLYQEAIAKDPAYPEAQASLASCYYLLPSYSLSARKAEYYPKARAAANRALELDADCAEAHAVLGNLQAAARDLKGAEEHFRKAIQLAPSYSTAHHWYGIFLTTHGRREEALAELRTAFELESSSPIIRTAIAHTFYFSRDFDRTIAEARNIIEASPEFPPIRGVLIEAQLQKGLFKEALVEIEKARALQPDEPLAKLEARGYALARLGETAAAEKIVSQLEEQRQQGKPLNGAIAFVYLGLGDYDKAADALEREYLAEGLDDEILWDPFFDKVRDLPRFQALLRKAGLT
jgi:serine/threonine-protein kinase